MEKQVRENNKSNIAFKIRLSDMNFRRALYVSIALFSLCLFFFIEGSLFDEIAAREKCIRRLDGLFFIANLCFILFWIYINRNKRISPLEIYKNKRISTLILLSLFIFWASIALSLHLTMNNPGSGYYFYIICIFVIAGLFYLDRKARIFIWCLSLVSFFGLFAVLNPSGSLLTKETIIIFPPLVISYLLSEILYWYMYVFFKQNQENTQLNIMLAKKNIQLDDKVKKKTRQLLEAKEQAEDKNQQKTDFIVNMSHDIRNPLSVILGYAELLSEENLSEEEKKEAAIIIKDSSKQLNVLISDIIDLSKIDAGKMNVLKTNVNLNNVMDNLFASFRIQIENKDKKDLRLRVSKNEPDEIILLYTDEIRLKQILTNFLDNAVKFTEKGFIDFGYIIEGANIKFFVKDSGIGISKEHQMLVFQQFQQLKNIDGGKGLGLAICYNLIMILGGEVWLESEEGVGTEFYFTLPYKIENRKKTRSDVIDKTKSNFDYQGKIIGIFVREDSKDSHLDLLLKKHNSYNILYNSIEDLTEFISQEDAPIDLLLMDFNIQNDEDNANLKKIKTANANLPIIGQSAQAFKDEKSIYLSLGFDDFFFKPFDTYNLLNSINNIFNKK